MCVLVLVVIVPRLGLSVRLDRDLLGSEVYLRLTEVALFAIAGLFLALVNDWG
jgi:hypothetical protein